jgi:tetratricopeptide (TPR) repeat protein
MIISEKLSALLDIGNCGEVISLADNDVLPILNKYIIKPRLNKLFPLGLLFDTWLKVYLVLATALALQGNERTFDVLKNLFEIIDKHKIADKQLIARAKTVQAYAYTMKGDINLSMKLLQEVDSKYRDNFMDEISVSRLNLVYIINKFFTKDYEGLREDLFEAVTFANNAGDNFTKNIIKTLLGKLLKDENKAQQALEIYNEQVTYFAKEKMALGALLAWYLIADATIVTENSKSAIDIASQALEISVNPNIDNCFFAVNFRLVLAKAYMNIADYTSAKINIEEGLKLAKRCKMYDMLSRLYLLYGKYYYDIGKIATQDQIEYLRGSAVMFEKAMEFVVKETKNQYIKNSLTFEKEKLNDFCAEKGFKL